MKQSPPVNKKKKARKEWAAFCRAIPIHRIVSSADVASGVNTRDSAGACADSRPIVCHGDRDSEATSKACHRKRTEQRANEHNVKRKKNAPRADQCAFIVPKRNKRCNLSRAPGSAFCGIHRPLAAAESDGDSSNPCQHVPNKVKVACPQCGNLLRKSKLASHLRKKCNAVRRAVLHKAKPYFSLDVNCPGRVHVNSSSESADDTHRRVGVDVTSSSCSSAPEESSIFGPISEDPDLSMVRGIVKSLFAKCKRVVGDVRSVPSSSSSSSTRGGPGSDDSSPLLGLAHESAKGCVPGSIVHKHLQQQAAILKVLRQRDLLRTPTSFASRCNNKVEMMPAIVDFGAARAMMSLDIAGMVPVGTPLLAVERSRATKNAADKLLRRAGHNFRRLTLDIKDLDLARVSQLWRQQPQSAEPGNCDARPQLRSVVAVSKHLCGAATDLMIRCIHNFNTACKESAGSIPRTGLPCQGGAVALCCHHLCQWDDYVGKEFFRDVLNLGRTDFERLVKFSHWTSIDPCATSGGPHDTVRAKRAIGWYSKRIIDFGRVSFLQSTAAGYTGMRGGVAKPALLQYCDPNITPENCMLVFGGRETVAAQAKP